MLSVGFDDNPDSELPIEIVRSLTSVTLDLQEFEEYPIGLAEPEEILVVPQDNLSVLLRDRLLSEENKKYCNLVGDLLYFAKSVDSHIEVTEQTTEVYSIGFTVTQEARLTGVFVPVTGVDKVLGISYFPAQT